MFVETETGLCGWSCYVKNGVVMGGGAGRMRFRRDVSVLSPSHAGQVTSSSGGERMNAMQVSVLGYNKLFHSMP